jgi:hypothetical protein
MNYLTAFVAGFLSTLVFHQGALAILHAAGLTTRAPYSTTPMWPFHVPAVVSLAFWGGVWAVVLWRFIDRSRAPWAYWIAWVGLGAILPSAVAWFVVFPLKGMPLAGGWSPEVIAGALLLNGAWGFGVALLLRGVDWLRSRAAGPGSNRPAASK